MEENTGIKNTMLRLDKVSQVFSAGTSDEHTALRNINLKVARGDFVTIIGSNGAGKTTLYNAIAGTFFPTQGEIFVTDAGSNAGSVSGVERNVTRAPEYTRARYIGRIFQNPTLGTAGNMSLADNMLICHKKGYKGLKISLTRKLRAEFRDRLRTLDMGLEDRMEDNVGLFSGGQRQALTLLMTVLSHPALLLLDEHTAALDPHNAEHVMNLTLRFAAEEHLTVLMITHNMAHALQFGNRLLMMDAGEVILDIDAAEKARLSTADIVKRFHDIKHKELATDEILLG